MMDPWLELFDFIHMWVIQSMATHKAFEAALARRLRRGDRLMMSLVSLRCTSRGVCMACCCDLVFVLEREH